MSKLKITTLIVLAIALIGFIPVAKADNIYTHFFGRASVSGSSTDGKDNIRANAEVRAGASLNSDSKGDNRDRFFVNASTTLTANNIVQIKAKADREITRRIDALNKLGTRINGMARISASDKASLSSSIQAEITQLTTLKAKIDADTDVSALRSDIASITVSYRIYMLVVPKLAVLAAADRINTIVDMMTTIGVKFQTRITAAGTAGKGITSLQASLNDYNSKVADAKVQYQAAISLVINLNPDNGDQTIAAANKQALVDARAKIRVGQKDLQAAREDARKIIRGLIAYGDTTITASSSSSLIVH